MQNQLTIVVKFHLLFLLQFFNLINITDIILIFI